MSPKSARSPSASQNDRSFAVVSDSNSLQELKLRGSIQSDPLNTQTPNKQEFHQVHQVSLTQNAALVVQYDPNHLTLHSFQYGKLFWGLLGTGVILGCAAVLCLYSGKNDVSVVLGGISGVFVLGGGVEGYRVDRRLKCQRGGPPTSLSFQETVAASDASIDRNDSSTHIKNSPIVIIQNLGNGVPTSSKVRISDSEKSGVKFGIKDTVIESNLIPNQATTAAQNSAQESLNCNNSCEPQDRLESLNQPPNDLPLVESSIKDTVIESNLIPNQATTAAQNSAQESLNCNILLNSCKPQATLESLNEPPQDLPSPQVYPVEPHPQQQQEQVLFFGDWDWNDETNADRVSDDWNDETNVDRVGDEWNDDADITEFPSHDFRKSLVSEVYNPEAAREALCLASNPQVMAQQQKIAEVYYTTLQAMRVILLDFLNQHQSEKYYYDRESLIRSYFYLKPDDLKPSDIEQCLFIMHDQLSNLIFNEQRDAEQYEIAMKKAVQNISLAATCQPTEFKNVITQCIGMPVSCRVDIENGKKLPEALCLLCEETLDPINFILELHPFKWFYGVALGNDHQVDKLLQNEKNEKHLQMIERISYVETLLDLFEAQPGLWRSSSRNHKQEFLSSVFSCIYKNRILIQKCVLNQHAEILRWISIIKNLYNINADSSGWKRFVRVTLCDGLSAEMPDLFSDLSDVDLPDLIYGNNFLLVLSYNQNLSENDKHKFVEQLIQWEILDRSMIHNAFTCCVTRAQCAEMSFEQVRNELSALLHLHPHILEYTETSFGSCTLKEIVMGYCKCLAQSSLSMPDKEQELNALLALHPNFLNAYFQFLIDPPKDNKQKEQWFKKQWLQTHHELKINVDFVETLLPEVGQLEKLIAQEKVLKQQFKKGESSVKQFQTEVIEELKSERLKLQALKQEQGMEIQMAKEDSWIVELENQVMPDWKIKQNINTTLTLQRCEIQRLQDQFKKMSPSIHQMQELDSNLEKIKLKWESLQQLKKGQDEIATLQNQIESKWSQGWGRYLMVHGHLQDLPALFQRVNQMTQHARRTSQQQGIEGAMQEWESRFYVHFLFPTETSFIWVQKPQNRFKSLVEQQISGINAFVYLFRDQKMDFSKKLQCFQEIITAIPFETRLDVLEHLIKRSTEIQISLAWMQNYYGLNEEEAQQLLQEIQTQILKTKMALGEEPSVKIVEMLQAQLLEEEQNAQQLNAIPFLSQEDWSLVVMETAHIVVAWDISVSDKVKYLEQKIARIHPEQQVEFLKQVNEFFNPFEKNAQSCREYIHATILDADDKKALMKVLRLNDQECFPEEKWRDAAAATYLIVSNDKISPQEKIQRVQQRLAEVPETQRARFFKQVNESFVKFPEIWIWDVITQDARFSEEEGTTLKRLLKLLPPSLRQDVED